MAKRKLPEINAGSMADIAFLLLVFFLVTTSIQTDAGLNVMLPPYLEATAEPPPKNKRNIFAIQINARNELLIRGNSGSLKTIRPRVKEFLNNRGRRSDLSDSPKVAVVSLLNDNGTSYETYIGVYNEIKAAYNDLWDELSDVKYSRKYADLTKAEQKTIRTEIPLVISEAEPSDNSQAI